jgi:threonine synthase
VPAPLGDRLILSAIRESGGDAEAADEDEIRNATTEITRTTGVDASPEGGCALAVCRRLMAAGRLSRDAEIVLFNTGAGASYRA